MIKRLLRRVLGLTESSTAISDTLFVHPIFGNCRFNFATKSWTARGQFAGIHDLLICGRSERPTDTQVYLWEETQKLFPRMLDDAIDSISIPTEGTYTPAEFNKRDAVLKEVRFEEDGNVEFFLSPSIVDAFGYEMFPMIIFRNGGIIASEWTV